MCNRVVYILEVPKELEAREKRPPKIGQIIRLVRVIVWVDFTAASWYSTALFISVKFPVNLNRVIKQFPRLLRRLGLSEWPSEVRLEPLHFALLPR